MRKEFEELKQLIENPMADRFARRKAIEAVLLFNVTTMTKEEREIIQQLDMTNTTEIVL